MQLYIRYVVNRLLIVLGLILIAGCSRWETPVSVSDAEPLIFPDYKEVTIPCNIAPMDFEVTSEEEWALKIEAGDKVYYLSADNGLFSFGRRFWKKLLEENRGSSMPFTLCFRGEEGWTACNPFEINVAQEEIDRYIVYRLIPPGYSLWNEMGIYHRDMTSFDENAIYRNTQGRGNCVNCHSFRDRDPEDMLFHMRSELAGTYIFRDGVKEKLDTKTEETISPLVYPYWHTSGRYVAFSVNKTNQTLHVKDRNQIEVFDEASDVVVYDVENHEIVTSDILGNDTLPPSVRALYKVSTFVPNEQS